MLEPAFDLHGTQSFEHFLGSAAVFVGIFCVTFADDLGSAARRLTGVGTRAIPLQGVERV